MALLFFLVYDFREVVVWVEVDRALSILMLHLGHVLARQALVRALFQVGQLYERLPKLILMHTEVREQIGWLSVIWRTRPPNRRLLIYLILINFTILMVLPVRHLQLLLLDRLH